MEKKIYTFMLSVLLTATAFAQQITLHVETAGKLSSMIAASKKDVITDLKLTGQINYSDISFLKSMKSLEYLDIQDAIYGNGKTIDGFSGMPKLKSIILPKSITEIYPSAFRDCQQLESVIFSDSDNIETIKYNAFEGCKKLITINLPLSLKKIESRAFLSCGSLKSVTIPQGVTSIGEEAFQDCTSLESITLPEELTEIPSNFVKNCSSLQSFVIPDKVQSIKQGAFYGCTNLKELVIGKRVTSMEKNPLGSDNHLERVVFKCLNISSNISGNSWFKGYKYLKTIQLENTVQSIRESAFSGCTKLDSVYIPASVSSIGVNAFYGCTNLQSFTVDENNSVYSSLDHGLYNKDRTTLICYFGDKSKDYCLIPETVTSIEVQAFNTNSFLRSLVIPSSVTEIGSNAFSGCTYLEEIYIHATTPPAIATGTFSGVNQKLCTLYVPVGTYSAYWLAPGWGDFVDIKEFDLTGIQRVDSPTAGDNLYYSLDGRKLVVPTKGINVVKTNDGKVKKMFIK